MPALRQHPCCAAPTPTAPRCFIPDKDLKKLLRRYASLVVTHTKRHFKISHPVTGDFVIAPVSGSDWRGLRNLRKDLERLIGTGHGYLSRAAERRQAQVQP